MRNLDELRNQINRETQIRVSSKFTTIGVMGSVLLVLAILPYLHSIRTTAESGNYAIGLLLMLVIFILVVLQLIHAVNAYLTGSKLKIKRVFDAEETIDLADIYSLKEFSLKNTKYTIFKYKSSNSEDKTRLILNSRSLIFGNEMSAKEIIIFAKKEQNR